MWTSQGHGRSRSLGTDISQSPVGDPSRIDEVSLTPDGSVVELHVVQVEPWDRSDAQALAVGEKLSNYVTYARSGVLAREHPDLAGRPWRIVLACTTVPDRHLQDYLGVLTEAIRRQGGELRVRPLAVPAPYPSPTAKNVPLRVPT